MWNELKTSAKEGQNFVLHRWDNPLHNDHATHQQSQLWPSGEDFYHPLNPMFSFFLKKEEHLSYFQTILLRDGAQGILDFFLRFPKPTAGCAKVIVQKDLLFLVPSAWRKEIFCYDLESGRKYQDTGKYVFYGLLSNVALSWPLFKDSVDQWLTQFDRNAEVTAFFSQRSEILDWEWREKKITTEISAHFQGHFKKPIRFVLWNDVKALSPEKDITFVGLDLWRSAIGYCHAESLMHSRSPQVYPRGRYPGFRGTRIGQWPVSFHHHLAVYGSVSCPHDDFQFFSGIYTPEPSGPPLPAPIKPMLWDTLRERLNVQGLPQVKRNF